MTITEDSPEGGGSSTEFDGERSTPEVLSVENEEPQDILRERTTVDLNTTLRRDYLYQSTSVATTDCHLLPHGVYSVIPALLATIAWFACLSKDGCDYARVSGPIIADITNNPDVPFIDAGFTRYRTPVLNSDGEWVLDFTIPCEKYNTDVVNIDPIWYFAYSTSFVSLMMGGAGALFIWFSSCFVYKRNIWRWAGYELLAATVLLALTYTWFASELCQSNNCEMFYGARADILACILWAIATLLIFCKYPTVRIKRPGDNARTNNNNNQRPPTEISTPPTEVEMTNQQSDMESGEGAAADDDQSTTAESITTPYIT